MPQISLPIEFFRKERRQAYGDWRSAFWRELLANSLDAGAAEIRISIEDGRVIFADNGCGMTREVAEHVYLSIGRSTKDGKDGVGGFGRARILTCFGMDSYSLLSKDYLINGVGADYEIKPSSPIEGVILSVVSGEFPTPVTNQGYLGKVLSESHLKNLKIFLNGERLYPEWLYTPETAQPFGPNGDWGQVSSVEGSHLGRCVVRVNGLSMFNRATRLNSLGVIIDLEPAKSRELLNANRDGGKPELDKEIDAILTALNANPEAVTFQGWNLNIVEPGRKGTRKSPRTKDWLARSLGLLPKIPSSESPWGEDRPRRQIAGGYSSGVAIAPRGFSWEDPDKVQRLEKMFDGHERGWFVTTSNKTLKNEAERWRQENWAKLPLRDIQLILAWDAACEAATRTLADVMDREVSGWATGLLFSSQQATCQKIGSAYFLNLNPVKFRESVDKMSADAARRYLLSIALHEVGHIISPSHDELFAQTLTSMMCIVDQAAGCSYIKAAERKIKR